MTADAVAETVRAEMGSISIQAVYDVLGVLVDVGLIRRIQPAGSPARFEARVSDNHHHVICRSCGRVADVDCAAGSAPCLTAVDDMGYEIDEAEVIYWGLCPECQSQTRGEPASTDRHAEVAANSAAGVSTRQSTAKGTPVPGNRIAARGRTT